MPKVQPTGSSGSGRMGRSRRVASTLAEINVIPLVDVMLVLLVIFMITAPMIQRGIDVKLPEATRSNQITGDRVFITIPAAYRQNHIVYLGTSSTTAEPIRAEILQELVRQKMERAAEKNVYLQGDGAVNLQELMEITDKLKAAGVQNVGIVTALPAGR